MKGKNVLQIQSVFGDAANFTETMVESEPNRRIKNHCRRYQDKLKEKFREQNEAGSLFTSSIAFRVDRTEWTNETLYFMVMATTSLSVLNSFKTATQGLTQQGSELAVTDFFFYYGLPTPHGRTTCDGEEAEAIYEQFRGKKVSLGEVKRFVVEETPYPFHSGPLSVLENPEDGRLVEVEPLDSEGRPVERIREKLPYEVSKLPTDPDGKKKFGNFWLLRFRD
jgi:hypothetical protein